MSSDSSWEASEEESEESFETSKRKSSGKSQFQSDWILEIKFPDRKSALDQLTAEKIWCVDHHPSYLIQGGSQKHYKCNGSNINGSPCPVLKCLYFPTKSETVWLYKTNNKHNHKIALPTGDIAKSFDEEMEDSLKDGIVKLMKHLYSPEQIMLQLESDGFEVKNREAQIRNFCENAEQMNNKWTFEKSFDGLDQVKSYVKLQHGWRLMYLSNTHVGMNYYYRCKKVPKVGPQCSARKYFSFNNFTNKVKLYKNDCRHTHSRIMETTEVPVDFKPDWILKRLCESDRSALTKQGFRVLKAVGLQYSPVDSAKGHDKYNDYKKVPVPSGWTFEKKFPNEHKALEYLAQDDIWEIDQLTVYNGTSGRKANYICNQGRSNGSQCTARKCLFYSFISDEISLYRNNKEHSHDTIEALVRTTVPTTQNAFVVSPVLPRRERWYARKTFASEEKCINKQLKLTDFYNISDPHIANDYLATSTKQITEDVATAVSQPTKNDGLSAENNSNWFCEKSFTTLEEAKAYLNESNWSRHLASTSKRQYKTYYRCNMVKYSGPQCKARAFLLHRKEANTILVYRNRAQHSHDQLIMANEKLASQNWKNIQHSMSKHNPKSMQNQNGWRLETIIPTKDLVSSYLDNQGTWRCEPECCTSLKVFYCCTTKNCNAQMWLLYERNSDKVSVYRIVKHNHAITNKTIDLPLHFNDIELIPDTYPNSNIIVKEEVNIYDELMVNNQNESDAINCASI